jgi:hypothetical protein
MWRKVIMGSSRKIGSEDSAGLLLLGCFAFAILAGLLLVMVRELLASGPANLVPMKAAEFQDLGKYAEGVELPGEVIGWEGHMEAFHLNKVKLDDGRIVQVAIKSRSRVQNGTKVYVLASTWKDAGGQPLYILTRFRP